MPDGSIDVTSEQDSIETAISSAKLTQKYEIRGDFEILQPDQRNISAGLSINDMTVFNKETEFFVIDWENNIVMINATVVPVKLDAHVKFMVQVHDGLFDAYIDDKHVIIGEAIGNSGMYEHSLVNAGFLVIPKTNSPTLKISNVEIRSYTE